MKKIIKNSLLTALVSVLAIFSTLAWANNVGDCKRVGVLVNNLSVPIYVYWTNSGEGYITFGDNVPANTNSAALDPKGGPHNSINVWYHPIGGDLNGAIYLYRVNGVAPNEGQSYWWKTKYDTDTCVVFFEEPNPLYLTYGDQKVVMSYTASPPNLPDNSEGINIYVNPAD